MGDVQAYKACASFFRCVSHVCLFWYSELDREQYQSSAVEQDYPGISFGSEQARWHSGSESQFSNWSRWHADQKNCLLRTMLLRGNTSKKSLPVYLITVPANYSVHALAQKFSTQAV
jgi:hypothetical protein